jgi:hypothetical protein
MHASLASGSPSPSSRNGRRLAAGTSTSTSRTDNDAVSHARRTSERDQVQRRSSDEHRHRIGMQKDRPPVGATSCCFGRRSVAPRAPLTAASSTAWPPVAGASLSLGEHGPVLEWRRGSAAPVAAALSLTGKEMVGREEEVEWIGLGCSVDPLQRDDSRWIPSNGRA